MSEVDGGSYVSLGCWADTDPDDRDVSDLVAQMGEGISVDKCASYCASSGLAFAGIQLGGVCYCGHEYGSHGQSFGMCPAVSLSVCLLDTTMGCAKTVERIEMPFWCELG